VQEAAVTEEAVEFLGEATELMTEPALGIVGIGEHGSSGHGKDLGNLVGDVADGRGSEPTALREDEVGYHLQGR
jgi:hypothetical protein